MKDQMIRLMMAVESGEAEAISREMQRCHAMVTPEEMQEVAETTFHALADELAREAYKQRVSPDRVSSPEAQFFLHEMLNRA